MSLIKNNPAQFPIFSDLFDGDRFFNPGTYLKEFNRQFPPVNITESDKEYKIELAIPGYKKEEVKVHVENELLSISAEKKEEKSEENERYTRKEFTYGSFNRSFQLPKAANSDNVTAKIENGVLKLSVAKKDEAVKQGKKEIQVG